MKNQPSWTNWILVLGVISLAIVPLVVAKGAEFSGADGQAEAAINEIHPDYETWFNPIFEPASGEIESLLFATQAGIGAGIIGYVIGWYRGRKETGTDATPSPVKNKNPH
ncbi:energy-coupling factor ABC transporter substrate-binding protein [Thermosynechococcaceae cyanobacterium BACA0444]|uniref:Cobalt transport protein CbiN n=1 Tax=Pseudocalidococcus azoricus BACA0444 TaxID=2918990 RepID=A0AAE4FSM2_9CYAN|nr:energy-coupling factor ABC transporter substrate-binding protein [Pseudocalidococcus azoricus]MDS3861053.1 energy-coupling factor ABC transporter substrate-binding protein [Pseudocalidococcus azoricus BACA0444]